MILPMNLRLKSMPNDETALLTKLDQTETRDPQQKQFHPLFILSCYVTEWQQDCQNLSNFNDWFDFSQVNTVGNQCANSYSLNL